jgi:oligopeptide/dipeptide ABC transporter ATP-binding protein
MNRHTARQGAIDILKQVRIPSPEKRIDEYPHQLSGGMRQRAMIAIALACRPHLLIADEPTTALDVTIQAQILELIAELRREFNMAVLLITHDLGIVAEVADRVAVMYAGRIVESGLVGDVLNDPRHPYTQGLIRSAPSVETKRARLSTIEGQVPPLGSWPNGCTFAPRCSFARQECKKVPPLELIDAKRVACWVKPKFEAADE